MTILRRTFTQLTPDEQARELRSLEQQFLGALCRGSVQFHDGPEQALVDKGLDAYQTLSDAELALIKARIRATARALAEEEWYA